MNYESRYDAMKAFLFPSQQSSGKSKGYENSVVGDCRISDWSPHNVRRLFISGSEFYVQFYCPVGQTNNGIKFCMARSEMNCGVAANNDLQRLSTGDTVKSVFKSLVDFRQFSLIEEIVFCGVTGEDMTLIKNDFEPTILTKGSKAGTLEEKLKSKYPRLSRIYYVPVSMRNLREILQRVEKSSSMGVTVYSILRAEGVSNCEILFDRGDNSWRRGTYIDTNAYLADKAIGEKLSLFFTHLDALEQKQKSKELHEKAEADRGEISDSIIEFVTRYAPVLKNLSDIIVSENEFKKELSSVEIMLWGYPLLRSQLLKSKVFNKDGRERVKTGSEGLISKVEKDSPNFGYYLNVVAAQAGITDTTNNVKDFENSLPRLCQMMLNYEYVLWLYILYGYVRNSTNFGCATPVDTTIHRLRSQGLGIKFTPFATRVVSELSGVSSAIIEGIWGKLGTKVGSINELGVSDIISQVKLIISVLKRRGNNG